MEYNLAASMQSVQSSLVQGIVHEPLEQFPVTLAHTNPKIFAPASGRNALLRQRQQTRRLLVAQNRLRGLSVADGAGTFFRSVFMHGKAGRIDSQLDKMADSNVLFQDRMRYLETRAIFSVHGDTIDQLVAVGKLLLVEALLQ